MASDEEFIHLVKTLGVTGAGNKLRISHQAVDQRRKRIEIKYGIEIDNPIGRGGYVHKAQYAPQIDFKVENGVVLIGSDAHIWPGPPSTAMRAFINLCKELKPKIIIMNGDVLDFPRISRHQRIGWQTTPMPNEEIEAAQELLHQMAMAAPRAIKAWTIGNHDQRFETKLANSDPDYARIHGVHLMDHFPLWQYAWMVSINEGVDTVLVKHRYRGGMHAPHTNVLWAGCTIVTGHLHNARVIPYNDARQGTRYGVDTGCLADVNSHAFTDYTENSPKNWRSAFGVLTFVKGRLLMPELVSVWDNNTVQFRGQLIKV